MAALQGWLESHHTDVHGFSAWLHDHLRLPRLNATSLHITLPGGTAAAAAGQAPVWYGACVGPVGPTHAVTTTQLQRPHPFSRPCPTPPCAGRGDGLALLHDAFSSGGERLQALMGAFAAAGDRMGQLAGGLASTSGKNLLQLASAVGGNLQQWQQALGHNANSVAGLLAAAEADRRQAVGNAMGTIDQRADAFNSVGAVAAARCTLCAMLCGGCVLTLLDRKASSLPACLPANLIPSLPSLPPVPSLLLK